RPGWTCGSVDGPRSRGRRAASRSEQDAVVGPLGCVDFGAMRLMAGRVEVRYSGRLHAVLPEALRLLMIKSDGSVMVHADTGGYKPQNWMTPPTAIEEQTRSIVARAR